jgi:hypothetical protein
MNSVTASRRIMVGQLGFGAFLAVCVAVLPGLVIKRNEAGLSNYGIHAPTVVPYTIAFLATITGAVFARRVLPHTSGTRSLRRILAAYAVAMAAVLLSTYPYSQNHLLRDIHIGCGSIAYAVMIIASAYFLRFERPSGFFLASAVIVLLGATVSLVTLVGIWHLLFLGQIVTFLGFSCEATLVVHTHETGLMLSPNVRR